MLLDAPLAPSPAGHRPAKPLRRLHNELKQGIAEGALALGFTPRIACANGATAALDAACCWPRRRRGGTLPADALLPLLAPGGLAQEATGWALMEACRRARTWLETPLAIALPFATLRDGSLIAQTAAALEETGLPPEQLELGLTEPALAENAETALLALGALRDLGIGVALEGFGAASANLMTLRRLPLTAVKLDRTLVRDLPADPEAREIARAAIQCARGLGMLAVACGADTVACRDAAADLGADAVSGAACRV